MPPFNSAQKLHLNRLTLALLFGLTACSDSVWPHRSNPTPIAAPQAIYVNQLGFSPHSPKIATAHIDGMTPQKWSLIQNGTSVFTGQTTPLGISPQAAQNLHHIDFSDFKTRGTHYHIRIGDLQSPEFAIKKGLYRKLKYDALSFFYQARSDVPIEARYVGKSYARKAGHAAKTVACFSGEDLWGTQWPSCDYTLKVNRGWYDAGDYGKYVTNTGIATWTLLNAFERYSRAFADRKVKIPEAGNRVNDLLDEARQGIEFMLSMQVPIDTYMFLPKGRQRDGRPLKLSQQPAGGMVHHKVSGRFWPGSTTMAHEDTQTRYLFPPSSAATLHLAAIGAQCARIWRRLDPRFARRCLTAANAAYAAARNNPDIFAYDNFDGSGGYTDDNLADEFYWAETELKIQSVKTGAAHKSNLERRAPLDQHKLYGLSGSQTYLLPALSFASSFKTKGSQAGYPAQHVIEAATRFLNEIPSEPFHIPYYSDTYYWGSNGTLANRAIILGTAYEITGDKKYRNGVVHIMDYFLGRNPLAQSYISGYGTTPFKHPHHRFWTPQLDPSRPPAPAGVLSGGPNNDYMDDPIAKTMAGTCAPQTCWSDHVNAWTQNEVTIDWNAPLFWMAAFLDSTE